MIPVLAVTIATVAAVILIMYFTASGIISEGVFREGQSLAERYAVQVKIELETAMTAARTLSQTFSGLRESGNAERNQYNAVLKSVLEKNEKFLSVWTVWEPNALDGQDDLYINAPGHDATGRFVPAWSRATGSIRVDPNLDYEKEGVGDYYLIPKRTGQETVIEPYLYSYTGKKEDEKRITSIVVPITSAGKFLGVTGIDFDTAHFVEMTKGITPYETGYGLLVSNSAVRVTHPNKELIGKQVGDDTPDKKADILAAVKTGKPYALFKKNLATGAMSYLVYAPIRVGSSTTPWSFIIVLPLDKVLAGINRLLIISIIIGGAGALFGSLFMVLLATSIVRPIKLTTDMTKRYARGEFHFGGVNLRALDKMRKRGDELGDIAQAMDELRGAIADIAKTVKTASEEVTAGSVQVNSAAQALSQGTTEQAASGEEVSSSMEQMAANIRQTADNAMTTEKIAQKTALDAEHGGKAVMEAVTAMKEIASKISIIEEIARQTNLLALNAAIEAARAGDAGRGFAVVASEVRKLAERSQKAAGEITELARSSVAVSENAGAIMQQIVPDIRKTAELIQEITAASREQNAGVEQINKALLQLDTVIQQNASSSEELAPWPNNSPSKQKPCRQPSPSSKQEKEQATHHEARRNLLLHPKGGPLFRNKPDY